MNDGLEVLIVGSDHQNTLGVIRALASYGVTVSVLIHTKSNSDRVRCFKSRFLNGRRIIAVPDKEAILNAIREYIPMHSNGLIPVIPTNDFTAYCIDDHFDELSNRFVLPSIGNKEGEIAKMMDKHYLNEIVGKHGILVAKSTIVECKNDIELSLPFDKKYPCVLKPIVSAFGKKSDIFIVHSLEQLRESIRYYREAGYERIMVQEYIDKDYELCTFGCITANTREAYFGTLKKIRYYPYSRGASLSYAQFVNAPYAVQQILEFLININFNGLFDFETFVCGEKVYLNEINFRNSGNTWAIVKSGVNAPLAWTLDSLGLTVPFKNHIVDNDSFFMNETSDLHYLFDRKISPFSWLRDLSKVKAFNKFWIRDIAGSLEWYRKQH